MFQNLSNRRPQWSLVVSRSAVILLRGWQAAFPIPSAAPPLTRPGQAPGVCLPGPSASVRVVSSLRSKARAWGVFSSSRWEGVSLEFFLTFLFGGGREENQQPPAGHPEAGREGRELVTAARAREGLRWNLTWGWVPLLWPAEGCDLEDQTKRVCVCVCDVRLPCQGPPPRVSSGLPWAAACMQSRSGICFSLAFESHAPDRKCPFLGVRFRYPRVSC